MTTNFKIHYLTKSLGEVCEFQNGFAFQSNSFTESGSPILRISNIQNDGISYNRLVFFDKESSKENFEKYAVYKGDLVIAMSGATTGKLAICDADEVFYLNQRVGKFKPKKELLKSYLYYFLTTQIEENLKISQGAAQPNLSTEQIKNLSIPLPPLPEQQRIVAVLDQAMEAISQSRANAKTNLINSKQLFETYLQSVFTNKGNDWEEKTLEQISEVFGRGKSKHRPRNDKKLYGGNYPFIQTGDIRNCDHFITEYTQTYNETGLAQSKLWPAGTICITIAANIAETGVLSFDACFPDSVIGLVVDKKIAEVNFVEYLLQYFKARIQSLSKGSAQANINMGTFENELFPIPPLAEQQNLLAKLDALSTETKKLEAIYKAKLVDLDELSKSLLQKAFGGEI